MGQRLLARAASGLPPLRKDFTVSEHDVLAPGERFEYTSGVPLQTPSGFMVGSYGMVTAAGEYFDIEVPAFSLDSSCAERTIN